MYIKVNPIKEDIGYNCKLNYTQNQFLKKAALITAVYLLMPESADALTAGSGAGGATGIVGIDNLWGKISPYLAGAFSVGGILYSAINIRKVVIGDYRAAAPAAISAIIGGIGVQGVFGANALSVMLP
jgi:preprotein translocase subunit SecG